MEEVARESQEVIDSLLGGGGGGEGGRRSYSLSSSSSEFRCREFLNGWLYCQSIVEVHFDMNKYLPVIEVPFITKLGAAATSGLK